ncbi:MAG TPA: hypothetical protein VM901_08565 [Bdellovibrionota bacterium]|jgi:hypothetical protein|nr:hypothetical protein [Bdellovibrionota bacterium]
MNSIVWLLALLLSVPALAMDPIRCQELIASLPPLTRHLRGPHVVGVETPKAGTRQRMDQLGEDEAFVYVYHRKLGLLWAKRDPENGQKPANHAETQYNGHGSLLGMIAEMGEDPKDIIDAGEGVPRGGRVYVTNRSGQLRPGPEGAEVSLMAMRELGLESNGRIIESIGTREQLQSINNEKLHANAAEDVFIKAKVKADPEWQRVHGQLVKYWVKLAETKLRPGLILDVGAKIEHLETLKDAAVDVSDFKRSERIEAYQMILRYLGRGESLYYITEEFMGNRNLRRLFGGDIDNFLKELDAAMLERSDFVRHPSPEANRTRDPAYLRLSEFMTREANFIRENFGEQPPSVHELGHGENATVYRLQGTDGHSIDVKVFRKPRARSERKALDLLSQFTESFEGLEVTRPLREEDQVLVLQDQRGVNLRDFLRNSKVPKEWKDEALSAYNEHLKKIRERIPGWAKERGLIFDSSNAVFENLDKYDNLIFTLKGPEGLHRFWIKMDNFLVKPDGSLVIIDPY